MTDFINLFLLTLSAVLYAFADVLMKKVSANGMPSIFNQTMLCIYLIYFIIILFDTWVFSRGQNFAVGLNLLAVIYAISCTALGVYFFNDTLTSKQWLGVFLGVLAVCCLV